MREDNIESIYPLSPLQQGMLFHGGYDQKTGVYVESLSFKIHGDLDVSAFKGAWQKVVERHSVLRTFFVWKNREDPLQIVRRQVELPWQEDDWRGLSESDQRDRLEQLLKTDQEQGFDLSKAPLQRLILIRLSQSDHQFVWSYHHIILDGWSLTILLDEVFSLYHSLPENRIVSQDQLLPYKSFINWLGQQDFNQAEAYWKRKLQGFSKPTTVNVGEVAKKIEPTKYEFDSLHVILSRSVSTALKSLARTRKLTLNAVFQGAWALILSRYSGERDIVFGAAVSGRSIPLPGIESMVGLFIGSLPVRVEIRPQESLITWLTRLQEQQLEARQFESTSLRDIQNWSGLDRSQGQPLFDTILSFNNYEFDHILNEKTGDLEIRDVRFREGSHYPLTVLIDPGHEIRIRINYDCSRYSSTVVKQILGNLQVLLEDIAVQPDKPIVQYPLLTPAEKQTLLIEFNNTGVPVSNDGTIVHLFEEQARLKSEAIALHFEGQTLTYDQLNKKANQLAHDLRRRGVGAEQVVALCLDRSPQAIIAILGTLKAGAGYLPLDPTLPSSRLELMLDETEAPVVLTTSRLAEKLPAIKKTVLLLDVDWSIIGSEPDENLPAGASPDNMAYIIYTSGSTGKPKGTVVRHHNLLNYISWAKDYYLKGEALDFPLFSSLSFDLTVTSIFVPLVSGGGIVIYGEGEIPGLEVLDVVREDRVDIIKLTPAHLTLLHAANLKSGRLSKMIVGGEDFKRSLAQNIHDLFEGRLEIYNEYGPTEATVGCMIHQFDPDTDTGVSVPIGRPIRNTRIYILDRDLQPVPPGVIGEMCISGAGVARGYLHRPELTETKFVADPFHPGSTLYRAGDLARWTAGGQMVFLGRSDHQVKIKGYRIELGEIESLLLEHPDIETAAVTVFQPEVRPADEISRRCIQCGLPDNYPGALFDSEGLCNTCRDFNELRERFRAYFRTPADLQLILEHARKAKKGEYDCMVLYSGGKDSSYMLYQLVREYGVRPLVFSLDNGYISEEAKANIRRVTDDLGVDLVFGQTPHMNEVFKDSLKRHSNVCNGCFKVIYTLSINLAHEKGIRCIFTGLSRGQLFETRLSDMFQARIFDVEEIDQTVLAARKAYHRGEDAVTQLLDVKIFESDKIFDEIQLVDFFRYTDVSLHEMYTYLDQNARWIRPSDTGRSTNCLINDVGIFIHKKERGFHNYALPYSWDVRVGHKTRAETVDELSDDIDEVKVRGILAEIGYDENERFSRQAEKRLVAYYVSRQGLSPGTLRQYLSTRLPEYMIPADFVRLDEMPLTVNGKVDRAALPSMESARSSQSIDFVAPTTPVEIQLAGIWTDVLKIQHIGIHENFFEIGGDSISTIRVMMRVSQNFDIDLLPTVLFVAPTIALLADRIEKILVAEIEQLTEEQARSLLSHQELDSLE